MNINVAMIGASGSGKTSFMSGLYHHFVYQRGMNDGLGLQPLQSKDATTSEAAVAAFNQVASVINSGEFPPGTVGSSTYKFSFMDEGNEICTFDWMDYRGGAIEEKFNTGTASPADYQEIRQAIDDAHAVAIFIDALQLVEYEKDFVARKFSGISVINQLMMALAIDYKQGKNLTVLFILTKCDSPRIAEDWRAGNYHLLMEKAKRLLVPSIDVIKSVGWRSGLVATGVAGDGNVETEKINTQPNGERTVFKNIIRDQPHPFHQNDALFYLLGTVLHNVCAGNSAQIDNLKKEAERAIANRGRLKDWWQKVNGEMTSDQIVQLKLNEISKLRDSLLRHDYKIKKMYNKSLDAIRVLTVG